MGQMTRPTVSKHSRK